MNEASSGGVDDVASAGTAEQAAYRVHTTDASCEASSLQGLNPLGGLVGGGHDTLDTLSMPPRAAIAPAASMEASQDPSTMMLKLLHMSMSENEAATARRKSATNQQVLAESSAPLPVDNDADSDTSSGGLTAHSYTAPGTMTMSVVAAENDEATLGSVLAERAAPDAQLPEPNSDPAGTAVQNSLQHLQSALRQLIREVNQQQARQNLDTSGSDSAVNVPASVGSPISKAIRLNPSLAALQLQHNQRLLAKKKALMAAAAVSSRQKQLAMLHRTSSANLGSRSARLCNGQPFARPQPFTTVGSRSSLSGVLSQTATQLPTLYMAHPSKLEGGIELRIAIQPEEQHRARYLTEGSRGAVKDRSGNAFPTVKLSGTSQGGRLLVFIGNDQGRAVPHMFYQASKVCGKNSTPCDELRIDGTTVIQIALPAVTPTSDKPSIQTREVAVDCVGILKERNVDVEKRLARYGNLLPPSAFTENASSSKKRSTRCRLVFRVVLDSGETLQIASAPILCTQPPGAPEICKKSLSQALCDGGPPDCELFIIGKNFLKDTKVIFRRVDNEHVVWQSSVTPEKEFLQATHLVCRVPPYERQDIAEPVLVELVVASGGRCSDPSSFSYVPLDSEPSNGKQVSVSPASSSDNLQHLCQPTSSLDAEPSGIVVTSDPQIYLQHSPNVSEIGRTASVVPDASTGNRTGSQEMSNEDVVSLSSPCASRVGAPNAVVQIPIIATTGGAATATVEADLGASSAGHSSGATSGADQPAIQFVVLPAGSAQTAGHTVLGFLAPNSLTRTALQAPSSLATANIPLSQTPPPPAPAQPPTAITIDVTQPVSAVDLVPDSACKRKISAEDIKPASLKDVVMSAEQPASCVPNDAANGVLVQTNISQTPQPPTKSNASAWSSANGQQSAENRVTRSDTQPPMSASDQVAIQQLATSLAASAQKVECVVDDLYTKKQKVIQSVHAVSGITDASASCGSSVDQLPALTTSRGDRLCATSGDPKSCSTGGAHQLASPIDYLIQAEHSLIQQQQPRAIAPTVVFLETTGDDDHGTFKTPVRQVCPLVTASSTAAFSAAQGRHYLRVQPAHQSHFSSDVPSIAASGKTTEHNRPCQQQHVPLPEQQHLFAETFVVQPQQQEQQQQLKQQRSPQQPRSITVSPSVCHDPHQQLAGENFACFVSTAPPTGPVASNRTGSVPFQPENTGPPQLFPATVVANGSNGIIIPQSTSSLSDGQATPRPESHLQQQQAISVSTTDPGTLAAAGVSYNDVFSARLNCTTNQFIPSTTPISANSGDHLSNDGRGVSCGSNSATSSVTGVGSEENRLAEGSIAVTPMDCQTITLSVEVPMNVDAPPLQQIAAGTVSFVASNDASVILSNTAAGSQSHHHAQQVIPSCHQQQSQQQHHSIQVAVSQQAHQQQQQQAQQQQQQQGPSSLAPASRLGLTAADPIDHQQVVPQHSVGSQQATSAGGCVQQRFLDGDHHQHVQLDSSPTYTSSATSNVSDSTMRQATTAAGQSGEAASLAVGDSSSGRSTAPTGQPTNTTAEATASIVRSSDMFSSSSNRSVDCSSYVTTDVCGAAQKMDLSHEFVVVETTDRIIRISEADANDAVQDCRSAQQQPAAAPVVGVEMSNCSTFSGLATPTVATQAAGVSASPACGTSNVAACDVLANESSVQSIDKQLTSIVGGSNSTVVFTSAVPTHALQQQLQQQEKSQPMLSSVHAPALGGATSRANAVDVNGLKEPIVVKMDTTPFTADHVKAYHQTHRQELQRPTIEELKPGEPRGASEGLQMHQDPQDQHDHHGLSMHHDQHNVSQQAVQEAQQMECQLQSMSMLPESELIRIINPESFAPGPLSETLSAPMHHESSEPVLIVANVETATNGRQLDQLLIVQSRTAQQ